ncbi:uncharacterized protein TNIN_465351 [Trichonephila inaurata madagascariensis]|uniref:Uncharacterized protein n=1 Tax=Trichonephila inaurata madagascariensis TaxID=2747483 RepID=A0A8X7C1J4_9ARAC|nr:uncharacterized protein TNIN_465351 [Trichonephila inaurata madagascariensis]
MNFLPPCIPSFVPDTSVSYCSPVLPANGVPGPITGVPATFPPTSHIANCATVAANTMVAPPVFTEVNSFLPQCVPLVSDTNVSYCNPVLPINGVPMMYPTSNHIADTATVTINTTVAAPVVAEAESFACLDNKLSHASGLLPRRIPSLKPVVNFTYRSPVLSANNMPEPLSGVSAAFQPASQIANNITIAAYTVTRPKIVAKVNRYS